MLLRSVALAVLLLALGACRGPGRGPAAQPGPVPTAGRVSAALGLESCRVVQRTIDWRPGRRLSVEMPIEGERYRIDLEPHSVRAARYRLLVHGAGGAARPAKAGAVSTLRGTVRGWPGCRVAGAMLADGLHLVVRLDDGRRCWMEPVPASIAPPHTYAVYDEHELRPTGGRCGTPEADRAGAEAGGTRRPAAGAVRIAQLACDADTEFVAAQGSVAAAEARINAVVNAVNVQYESEVGLRHEITTIVIRSGADPYTASGATDRLCEFIREWRTNQTGEQRDVAHLFTGVDLAGGTVGIAADIGGTGICVAEGGCSGGRFGTFGSYCLAQSDFSATFSCATDLTGHELGHLWGAFHCRCPASTMNPSITCANTFSAGTIQSILDYRDTRECLEEGDAATAGVNE